MRRFVLSALVSVATLVGSCVVLSGFTNAMKPLPKYAVPGERPPGLMKYWFGQLAGQLDLLGCEYDPPTEFDKPELLRQLYGSQFDPTDTSGHGGIVVLGAHNSGTSMVTRLIMLLGAFGGNFETISIHKTNKLKYYEPFSVALFHDAFLGKFVDTHFRPYHGQGLNFSSMTIQDQKNLDCFARKQIEDLQRHEPWVMKDPRMALVMPLWRPHIPNLVCVFVHKDPIKNSISLASNGKKSSQTVDTDMMTSQRWLDLWERTMINGLEGCRGAPTVLFDSKNIITDVDGSLLSLQSSLEAVGVRGLKMPDPSEINNQIKSYIRTGEREYKISASAQRNYNLTENPIVDATPPTPTLSQAALEESLLEHLRRVEGNEISDPTYLADSILRLANQISEEELRRAESM